LRPRAKTTGHDLNQIVASTPNPTVPQLFLYHYLLVADLCTPVLSLRLSVPLASRELSIVMASSPHLSAEAACAAAA